MRGEVRAVRWESVGRRRRRRSWRRWWRWIRASQHPRGWWHGAEWTGRATRRTSSSPTLCLMARVGSTSITSKQGTAAPALTLTISRSLTLTLTLTLALNLTLTPTPTCCRLHSEHPGPEPGEQEPLLLSDVQQDTLPGPPPPYRPDSKDQPALRHFIYLGTPPHKRHTF